MCDFINSKNKKINFPVVTLVFYVIFSFLPYIMVGSYNINFIRRHNKLKNTLTVQKRRRKIRLVDKLKSHKLKLP